MTAPEVLSRVRSHIWLKSIGSTVAISAFFVAYFAVLNHPLFPVREMQIVGVDRWTPVLPFSAWIYFTLWIYICLPSSLMHTRKLLGGYLLGATVLSGLAMAVFILYPTAVPTWDFDWDRYPTLAFLKSSDASGNACPSLHVGFAVFAAVWMQSMLRNLGLGRGWQAVNWLWCLGIILSTLTTKQHVFIDLVCGAILGGAVAVLNLHFIRHETVAPVQVPRN